jgi:N-acylneuraminate-9-phosphatase
MGSSGKSIKAIFFDLDETLIPESECMRVATRRASERLAGQHPEIEPAYLEAAYLKASREFWSESNNVPKASESGLSDGNLIRIEVWNSALSLCGIRDRDIAIEVAGYYTKERKNSYRLFPEVEDVLKILIQTFTLGIITNGANAQREKIENTSLRKYIDLIMISGEAGVGKPGPEIFAKALSSVGARPEEAVHVGDSLNLDIIGAQKAGIYAVWLNRNNSVNQPRLINPDCEIANLTELLPILRNFPGSRPG